MLEHNKVKKVKNWSGLHKIKMIKIGLIYNWVKKVGRSGLILEWERGLVYNRVKNDIYRSSWQHRQKGK